MLKRIAEVWATRRGDIMEQSADTMRQLAEATQSQGEALERLCAVLPSASAGAQCRSSHV